MISSGVEMKVKRIDHVGIAVKDIAKAMHVYKDLLQIEFEPSEEVEDQKVIAAKGKVGESHIELLEATAPDSPIARFIEKHGPGIHHICLAVDDIATALTRFCVEGYTLIDKLPREGAGGKQVAFLHPVTMGGVLLELSED
jgi:methylmalonyl-CoA/ethylmalonyl-CoA epimerase